MDYLWLGCSCAVASVDITSLAHRHIVPDEMTTEMKVNCVFKYSAVMKCLEWHYCLDVLLLVMNKDSKSKFKKSCCIQQ